MALALKAGGGGEFNQIRGQIQNIKTLKIINFVISIKDNYAVAVFDDPSFARKMVKQENKSGNMNIKFSSKINGAIEHYPGQTKDEISRIMLKKLKKAGAKIQK